MRGMMLMNTTVPEIFGGATTGFGGMDIAIDAGGHIIMLEGRERVRHDVLKGVLTGRSGGYGTTIPSLIGQKRERGFMDLVAATAQRFLDDYRDAQSPDLPDEERIETIQSLNITDDPGDKTKSVLTIVLNMADGQSVEIEHRF